MKVIDRLKYSVLRLVYDPDLRLITVIFIPIFIDMILNNLISTAHSYFVAGLGDDAISAVGLAGQANNLFVTLFSSLCSALTVIISQYNGAGDLDGARKSISQTMLTIVVISGAVAVLLFMFPYEVFHLFFGNAGETIENLAVDYMNCIALSLPFFGMFQCFCCASRGLGNNKVPLYISVSGSVVNLICAFLFINVFELGIIGAGLGFIVSRIFSTVIGFVIFIKQRWLADIKDTVKLDLKALGKVTSLGFLISSESIIVTVGAMVKMNFLVPFGSSHMAARSIDATFNSLCLVPITVLGTVTVTLVGRYIGSGAEDEARNILKKLIKCTYVLFGLTMAVSLLILPPLFKGYTEVPDTLSLLNKLLYIHASIDLIVLPFLNITLSGFKAAGDARFSTVVSIICMWVINVGLGYVLVKICGLGAIGFILSASASALVKAIVMIFRYRSGKWIHKKMI